MFVQQFQSANNLYNFTGTKENNMSTIAKIASKDFVSYVLPEFRDKFLSRFGRLCPNSLIDITKKLRLNLELNDFEKETIKNVDAAFKKLPELTEDKIVYRSMSGLDLDENVFKAKIGDEIIPDRGYAQAGINEYYAAKYLPAEHNSPVLFEMRFPKGSKLSFSKSTGTGFEEGFLPRNAKFKVLDRKDNCEVVSEVYQDYETGEYKTLKRKNVTKFVLEFIDDNSKVPKQQDKPRYLIPAIAYPHIPEKKLNKAGF